MDIVAVLAAYLIDDDDIAVRLPRVRIEAEHSFVNEARSTARDIGQVDIEVTTGSLGR